MWKTVILLGIAAVALAGTPAVAAVKLTVLFDNMVHDTALHPGWGYACLVESDGAVVLFDTGADGDALLANMAALGKDPATIDAVVLSHEHGDHTGGLEALLRHAKQPRVLVLAAFPDEIAERATAAGGRAVVVDGPLEVCPGIWTTGPVEGPLTEQALVVESADGPVMITGCAHPGVARMAEQAAAVLGRAPALVIGGFHLRSAAVEDVDATAARLRELGVSRLGPSHCTGEPIIERLAAVFGPEFVRTGLGWSTTLATITRVDP